MSPILEPQSAVRSSCHLVALESPPNLESDFFYSSSPKEDSPAAVASLHLHRGQPARSDARPRGTASQVNERTMAKDIGGRSWLCKRRREGINSTKPCLHSWQEM